MPTFKNLGNFVKIEHTLFSLPMLFAGLLAGLSSRTGQAPALFPLIAWVLLAGVGARTLALALNRILDRAIDARNPRTAGRELPSGRLSLGAAWAVALGGGLLYLAAAWALGGWCLRLAPIPPLVFILYPLMKRFTPAAHLGVGLGLAMAPLGGWMAAAQAWPASLAAARVPALLAGFTLCWVSGFDVLYAIQDLNFDRREGLHSIPARLGAPVARASALALHLGALACLVGLGLGFANAWAWLALAPAALLLALEQALGSSLEPGSRFFTVNAWLGFAVLLFVAVGFWRV
jgi:4-hydroxybenzoate polyprenyltransferase